MVAKMMAKEPERRFQEPKDVAQALAPFFKSCAAKPSVSEAEVSRVQSQFAPTQTSSASPAWTQPPTLGAVPSPTRRGASKTGADGVAWDSLIEITEGDCAIKSASPKLAEPKPANAEELASRPPWKTWPIVATASVLVAVMLGVIIYIATDKGRIKIVVEGPEPIVTIDGEMFRIEGLGEPITLRAGEHVLTVKCGDTEVETHKFIVHRGNNEALRVEYQPKAERKVAERRAGASPPGDGGVFATREPADDVRPPMIDRTRYTLVGGHWTIEGDDLVQTDAGVRSAVLMFGDERWTDYDFTVEAMRTIGRESFSLFFRGKDQDHSYAYVVSGKTGRWCYAEVYDNDCTRIPNDIPFRIQNDTWYAARVEVRGGRVRCFLRAGENEVELPNFTDDRHPNGRVGCAHGSRPIGSGTSR